MIECLICRFCVDPPSILIYQRIIPDEPLQKMELASPHHSSLATITSIQISISTSTSFVAQAEQIQDEPDTCSCSPFCLMLSELKETILVEVDQWRIHYGRQCSAHCRQQMHDLFALFDKFDKSLSFPINDLEDIGKIMQSLQASISDEHQRRFMNMSHFITYSFFCFLTNVINNSCCGTI